MKYIFLLLLSVITLPQTAVAALPADFVPRGDTLQEEVRHLLRALRYADTVNTPAAKTSLTALLDDFSKWKAQLEEVLLDNSLSTPLSDKVPLIELYFQLVTDLVRIKQLSAPPLQWSEWGRQFDLRAPRAVVWHYSAVLQKLWAQKLNIINTDDNVVRLSLKASFVAGVQIATIAHDANADSHLQAVKYLIYTTLYQQLARNAFYRGGIDSNTLLAPDDYDKFDLRQRLVTHIYRDQQRTHLHHALLATLPQLSPPPQGLQQPLIANWELYAQLAAAHPHLSPVTTPELAATVYALLDNSQKYALAVNDAEDMRRFMLLAEHLLLPLELEKNLKTLPVEIDGSDTSLIALQHAELRSRANALRAALTQLQLSYRDERQLYAELSLRERELQKNSPQQTARWHAKATTQLPHSKEAVRENFIRKVLLSARHAADIEAETIAQPVQLPVLRKALLHSLFVMDFSGEVQESIAAVLRQQDYRLSRQIFFQELHRHFTRLLPTVKIEQHKLAALSHDDIVSTYINPALAQLEEHEQDTTRAINHRTRIHHLAQLKSLLQYGDWFGYFSDNGTVTPTLDMLPLDAHQRANYQQELRHVYLDEYPFLLLEKNGKKLYQVLAAMTVDKDFDPLNTEAIWSLLSKALKQQHAGIKAKIVEIDRAESLQDIKHLAAGSPLLSASMREFEGLFPLHEKFVKRYSQPSKFQHNWEAINLDYIGSFFTVMIGYHLGGWLLRRSMFGTAGAHILSWLSPVFGGAMPYASPLLHAMWGVILFEYFVAMPYHTFVIKPQKLQELQEYYQLGSAHHNLINGTYLNYYRQERNGHFLNYALEMSMHTLFVGWWVYNLKFSHVMPKLKENKLQKLLQRIGVDETVSVAYRRKHNIFKPEYIKRTAQQQIAKIEQTNNVSRHYKNTRIQQIKTARQKLLSLIEDKAHALKVAAIEHRHDFAALGMSEPIFDFNTITRAYGLIEHGYKTGVYSEAVFQQAELARGQLQMTLIRRLKISPLQLGKDKMVEATYQRALGEAVAESLSPKHSKAVIDRAVLNFYLSAAKMNTVATLDDVDHRTLRQLQNKLAGKLSDNSHLDYFIEHKTFSAEIFAGDVFVGAKLRIIHATPAEMQQLLKHIKTLGYNTKGIKTLQDVRNNKDLIAKKKKELISKYTVSPGMSNDTPHKKKNRDRLNQAWASIEYYLNHGHFQWGGS